VSAGPTRRGGGEEWTAGSGDAGAVPWVAVVGGEEAPTRWSTMRKVARLVTRWGGRFVATESPTRRLTVPEGASSRSVRLGHREGFETSAALQRRSAATFHETLEILGFGHGRRRNTRARLSARVRGVFRSGRVATFFGGNPDNRGERAGDGPPATGMQAESHGSPTRVRRRGPAGADAPPFLRRPATDCRRQRHCTPECRAAFPVNGTGRPGDPRVPAAGGSPSGYSDSI
jgi:hypothetical protein